MARITLLCMVILAVYGCKVDGNRVIYVDDHAAIPVQVIHDLDMHPRIINSVIDMGPYEYHAKHTKE